ncbi:MAG: F0F1 ATP synthase subunit epsilon [Thiohalocapsa sp.]|nr:F0F1 ATP synthase subunit epsilon [Thiohalocapsa sp.]MCF7989603.1 F0F1 ATP synthase subunit epsilon [Thiohalocapsa sp.]
MRLRLFVPTETLVDAPVRKVIAEAENGSFGMLPRHIDFVAALVPGILIYVDEDGAERFYAVDAGTLVKVGDEVRVSTFNAIAGTDLGALKRTVQESFEALEEHEREARSALARLEAGTLRRFFRSEEMR